MNLNSQQQSKHPLNQNFQEVVNNQYGSLSSHRNSLISFNSEMQNLNSAQNMGPNRLNMDLNQIPYKDKSKLKNNISQEEENNFIYGNMGTEEIEGSQVIAEFPIDNQKNTPEQSSLKKNKKLHFISKSIKNMNKSSQKQSQENINNQNNYNIKDSTPQRNTNIGKFTYILPQKEDGENQNTVLKQSNKDQNINKNSRRMSQSGIKKKNRKSIIKIFRSKPKFFDNLKLPDFDMRILVNVWQFIYNLRLASYIWTPKMYLNKRELDLVHDKAAFHQKRKHDDLAYNESADDYIQTKNSFIVFIENLAVLNPDSSFFYFWDLIHCIIIILQMFFVPIEWVTASTFTEYYKDIWYYFIYISITVFSFNVILNFNVGFYDKGMCNMNRIDIIKQYLRLEFWLDLICILPQLNQLLLFDNELRIVNFFIVFKIKSIYVILKKYQEMSSIKKNVLIPSLIRLGRLFFNILFAAHIIGCIFLGIGIQENKYQLTENNWISKYDESLIDSDWNVQYFYCLYWAVTTMTSVGYGDITPSNEYETIFVTFIMFVACFTFAYSFNLIGMLVDDMNNNAKQFNQEMRFFQSYFDAKNINKGLQIEIRKHLEYQYHESNDLSVQDEQNIIEKVPEGMKQKLIQSANIQYLEKAKFFKNFTPQLFNQLVMEMVSISCLNNEIVFDKSESQQNPCIYFIVKGSILILTPKAVSLQAKQAQLAQEQFDFLQENNTKEQLLKNYTIIKKLNKYEYFGEQSFLLGNKRTTIAKCDGPCHLLKIERKKFIELIKQSEQDHEIFCNIRDKCLINNNFQDLELQCFNCQKRGHQSLNCPRIHYIPNIEKIFLKMNFNTVSKDRVRYLRIPDKTPNSLIDLILNVEIATEVIEDLEKEEYEEYLQKYYKLVPYEERMENFFQIQNQNQPMSIKSSPKIIPEINIRNSNCSLTPNNNNNVTNTTQDNRHNNETHHQMNGNLGNNFTIGSYLDKITSQKPIINSNSNINSPSSNKNINQSVNNYLQPNSFSNMVKNTNPQISKINKRFQMDQSTTSNTSISNKNRNNNNNNNILKQSVRKIQSLQKFSAFKAKLNNHLETTQQHQEPTNPFAFTKFLKDQAKQINEQEKENGQKTFTSKRLANVNYLKRLNTVQQSTTIDMEQSDQKSQQQLQLDLLQKQQQEFREQFKKQQQNDYIETNFPSINTDSINQKGFQIYFPYNNVQKVLQQIINNETVTLKSRNRSYHLYDRKIVYIKQVEQIRLLQIGIEKQSQVNQDNSQGRKGTQKRRMNNVKDNLNQEQIQKLEQIHNQGLSYKQKKMLEQQPEEI